MQRKTVARAKKQAAPPAPATDTAPLNHEADAFTDDLLKDRSSSSSIMVGAADDPAEREADAVADRVMQMRIAPVAARPMASDAVTPQVESRPALVSRKCKACGDDELVQRRTIFTAPKLRRACSACESKEEDTLRRDAEVGAAGGQLSASVASRVKSLPTRALPAQVRTFMEPRFGTDFGHIRLATGTAASVLNRQLNARAFSFGSTIAFGDGAFEPASSRGRRLIAHELAHTLQDGRGVNRQMLRRAPLSTSSSENNTPDSVLADVEAGSFHTLEAFRARIDELTSTGRRKLLDALTSSSFFDQEAVNGFIEILRRRAKGIRGGTIAGEDTECDLTKIPRPNIFDLADAPEIFELMTHEPGTDVPVINRNSGGAAIWFAQSMLAVYACERSNPPRNFFPNLDGMGRWGAASRRAVRFFQSEQDGLKTDGSFGPNTLRRLVGELGLGQVRDGVDAEEVEFAEREEQARLELEEFDALEAAQLEELLAREEENRPGREFETPTMRILYEEWRDHLRGRDSMRRQAWVDALRTQGIPDTAAFEAKVRAVYYAYLLQALEFVRGALPAMRNLFELRKDRYSSPAEAGELLEAVRGNEKIGQAVSAKARSQREAFWKKREPELFEDENFRAILDELPFVVSKSEEAELNKVSDEQVAAMAGQFPVLGLGGFPGHLLLKQTTGGGASMVITDFLDRKLAAVESVKEQISEKPERVFSWEGVQGAVARKLGWKPDGIQVEMIQDQAKFLESRIFAKDIFLLVAGVTLAIASWGAATPAVTATLAAASVGVGIVDAAIELGKLSDDRAAFLLEFEQQEPSAIWAALAIVGVGADVAALTRAAKLLRPIAGPIDDFFRTTDLAAFEPAVKAAKLGDDGEKLLNRAKLRKAVKAGLLTAREANEGGEWARWLQSINSDTYKRLASGGLADALRKMPPGVRNIFTKCASDCLPPWLTGPGFEDLVKRLDVLEDGASEDAIKAMKALFHEIPDKGTADAMTDLLEAAAENGDDLGDLARRLLGSLDKSTPGVLSEALRGVTPIPPGTNLALGMNRAGKLEEFAKKRDAVSVVGAWDSGYHRLSIIDPDVLRSFFADFMSAFLGSGGRVKFDLTDLRTDRVGVTTWELRSILRNEKWTKGTDFFLDGEQLLDDKLQRELAKWTTK